MRSFHRDEILEVPREDYYQALHEHEIKFFNAVNYFFNQNFLSEILLHDI